MTKTATKKEPKFSDFGRRMLSSLDVKATILEKPENIRIDGFNLNVEEGQPIKLTLSCKYPKSALSLKEKQLEGMEFYTHYQEIHKEISKEIREISGKKIKVNIRDSSFINAYWHTNKEEIAKMYVHYKMNSPYLTFSIVGFFVEDVLEELEK